MELSDLKRDFGKLSLNFNTLPEKPAELLKHWLEKAVDEQIDLANAMVLSTVSGDGKPSSRTVLLKEITTDEGLVFYTNYESRKGEEIDTNPFVALNFFWKEFERQVRVEGKLVKTSREKSAAYFNSRPHESRINAIVSPQSQEIASLDILRNRAEKLKNTEVPAHWGGYEVRPSYYEFWQGGKNRLHDRITYTLKGNNWVKSRLAP